VDACGKMTQRRKCPPQLTAFERVIINLVHRFVTCHVERLRGGEVARPFLAEPALEVHPQPLELRNFQGHIAALAVVTL
jgi:hypothetical protein